VVSSILAFGYDGFHSSVWSGGFHHPLAATEETGGYECLMRKVGYSLATQLNPGGDDRSITVQVWTRNADKEALQGIPAYVVDVSLNPGGMTESIGVEHIGAVMDLLARWAPAVQAALACDEAAQRREHEDR
jgi:hypothetical protein